MQELYNYQPPVEQIDAQAQQEGDFNLLSIPSQLLYGFLEGMTTLPVSRWAQDEPDNMVESLANSLGHLMGFVGINPVGVGGKIASKLFTKGTMGKYLSALGQHTRMPSLPMYLGNKLSSGIQSFGLKPAMESIDFLKKNPQFQDMIQSGLTLGLQSAVGGAPIYDWSVGAIEDRMKSGAMGTLFGVGNAFVGNYFTRGGKYDVNKLDPDEMKALFKSDKQAYKEAIAASDFRNGLVRAAVSGAIFSTPSILMGQPLPVVLYDAALNSYFGYKESPYWMKTARAISERFAEAPDLLLTPKETINRHYAPDAWEKLDPRTRETLEEMADLQLGGIVNDIESVISGPSAEIGKQMFDFIKTAKVVPNDVEPGEGEIRQYDYNLWNRRKSAYDAYMEAIKSVDNLDVKDREEKITEFFRRNLTDMARDGLGETTRLGTVEMFDQLENMTMPVIRGLSNKANFVIDRAYKNEGLTDFFSEPIGKLVSKTFGDTKPLENDYTDRYVEMVGLTAKYVKDKTLTYKQFENELWDKYKIEPTTEMKYAYEVANQSVERGELTLDFADGKSGIRRLRDVDEREHIRPVKMEPRSLFQEMLDDDGFELSTYKDFQPLHEADLRELARDSGFNPTDDGVHAFLVHKLYSTSMLKGDKTFNLAMYSGNKDQSKLMVGKFLIDEATANDKFEVLKNIKIQLEGKKEPVTLEEAFAKGLRRFIENSPGIDKAEALKIYKHNFVNNIEFIERFHNKTLDKIAYRNSDTNELILDKKILKSYMIDPYALMKRTQGLNSHHIRVKPLDFAEEFAGLNKREPSLPSKKEFKVISGGQTGIDRLGLEYGKKYNFRTGGTAPKGYKTQDGSDYTLKDFGVVEDDSPDYVPRTIKNVKNSDGTVYFKTDEDSTGFKATRRAAEDNKKPFLVNPTADEMVKWMIDNNIKTLNVAGNRGSAVSNKFKREVESVLDDVFKRISSIEDRRDTVKAKTAEDMAEYEKRRGEALNALGQHRYIILNSVNRYDDKTFNSAHRNDPEMQNDYQFKVYVTDENGKILKNEDGTDKTTDKPFDAHLDGGELVRADVFEALLKSVGVSPVTPNGDAMGAYKGITIHRGNGISSGMFAKKAIFKATPEMSEWMKQQDIHSIEYDTTVKIGGERKGQNYMVENGIPVLQEAMQIYERPWESNTYLSTDQTYKKNHAQRMLKQLPQNIWTNTPKGRKALEDLLALNEMNIKGVQGKKRYTNGEITVTKDIDEAVTEYINYGHNSDFLLDAYENGELGLARKLSVFLSNRDSKLWRKLRDEIFDRELDNEWGENEEPEFQYFKDFGVMNKIIDALGDNVDPSILAAVNSSRNFVETALKRYVMNELIKPKVKEVMTSTATPQFPDIQPLDAEGKPTYIKKGEFYLGRGAKDQIVNWDTKETLEKAFNRAKIENKNLEYMVIRAPADSPSGIRALKFKGFIDADGTGIYTHPEEYFNLGGMDNDIDKVSIYFNLPKSVNEYYKTMKDQWYDDKGVAIPAKENPEYLNKKYEAIPFDPLTNIMINKNAYSGISILGQGLNFTNRLMVVHDWATSNQNGEIDIAIRIPKGPEADLAIQEITKLYPDMETYESGNGEYIYAPIKAKFKDKMVLSKHQRDIVNYAADASNGDPIKSIFEIMDIISKDMIETDINIKDIQDSRVYLNLPDQMLTRMEILDTIYSDRNKFRKTELISGREVPSRYSVWEMFQIMTEYARDIKDNKIFRGNSPNGYLYKTYEMMGEALSTTKFLQDNIDNYRWIGDDHSTSVLMGQLNKWFNKDKEGAAVANFHFRTNIFGLGFTRDELNRRVNEAWEVESARRESLETWRTGGQNKLDKIMKSKYKRYAPDFSKLEEMAFKRKIASDFRANDLMDMASILNVTLKGKPAIDKYGARKVAEIRDKVAQLKVDHSKVLINKKEGDLNAENDWVDETTKYLDSLNETPELRAYAEAQLISTVGARKNTIRQTLYPKFFDPENKGDGLFKLFKVNNLSIEPFMRKVTEVDPGTGVITYKKIPDAALAYYHLNSISDIRAYVSKALNPDKVVKAIEEYKQIGKQYMESGFRDNIARLPFVSTTTIGEALTTYQGILKYAKEKPDIIGLTMEQTKTRMSEMGLYETIFDKTPEMRKTIFQIARDDFNFDVTSDIKIAGSRLRNLFKRYPSLINRIESLWMDYQVRTGDYTPVPITRMTKAKMLKFVDWLEKGSTMSSYDVADPNFYITPDVLGERMQFKDSRYQQVVMRVRDGNQVRMVKVEMPSSRVNNSLLIADAINERRNAEYKEIESRIFSTDKEDITYDVYELDKEGNKVVKDGKYKILRTDTVINPIFIKSHLPFEDWNILQRFAILDYQLVRFRMTEDTEASIWLRKEHSKMQQKFDALKDKRYQVTYKTKTRNLSTYEVVKELHKYMKYSNRKGMDTLNDTLSWDRILSTDDVRLGYGIKGFEEHSIIRVTDYTEKFNNDVLSGKLNAYADMGINVHNLINWNSAVYNKRFKYGENSYMTIEERLARQKIYPNSKNFWQKYAEEVVRLKSLKDADDNPLHPILHNPPKRTYDIPKWFQDSYFPHMGHTRSAIEERMKLVLEKAKPDSAEYKKAELYLFRLGELDIGDTSETLQAFLTDDIPDDAWARISASVSNNLKARDDNFFVPGYKMDIFVYNDYFKSLAKQRLDTMMVTSHHHQMNRMLSESRQRKNSLTYDDAVKMRMFLDIRMMDVLGYPSQFPDRYVDKLKLDGTFYHKLTNDYWIRNKFGFVDKLLGIDDETPEKVRAAKINRAIQSLSNIEATWAMMPLLASPKFMITNRFSGGVTTVINAGMEYFVKAHRMAEVKKVVPEMNTYADMVDFVSQHGGIESFIKNELVLSQNVKIGDVTEFVKDVINFYKEGKEVPIKKMYELAKQRGLTQEFVDKAAYFMRASEIKNRVYAWFAHYMKAKNVLDKTGQSFDVDDPWLVAMANKGVAATQYLYDSLNRPAFARTALGKMLTRFQLFTYNNIKWRKQLLDNARYEDWNSPDGKRLANLVAMDMMVLTLATFFPGTMFSASLNQPYGWAKDLAGWLFGDEEEKKKAFFGAIPYPANIVQPILPPFTRFLINPIVALFDLEKFTSTLVWSLFPFGRLVNETRKSVDNPLLAPEKSLGIPFFSFIRRVQADYKRREKEEAEGTNPPAPTGQMLP